MERAAQELIDGGAGAPHDVTLKGRADEREIEILPEDCIRVEARQVLLEPSKHLPDLAMVRVDIRAFDS